MTKKTKAPATPKTKKELLELISDEGLQDFQFTSSVHDGQISFGLMLRTKKGRIFSMDQELELVPILKSVEVLDFTTGNGRQVHIPFGTGFDEKKVYMSPLKKYENADRD
jgi:hypothetical protein